MHVWHLTKLLLAVQQNHVKYFAKVAWHRMHFSHQIVLSSYLQPPKNFFRCGMLITILQMGNAQFWSTPQLDQVLWVLQMCYKATTHALSRQAQGHARSAGRRWVRAGRWRKGLKWQEGGMGCFFGGKRLVGGPGLGRGWDWPQALHRAAQIWVRLFLLWTSTAGYSSPYLAHFTM